MAIRHLSQALSLALMIIVGSTSAYGQDTGKFRVYTVDIGTGLCVYLELPTKDGGRPAIAMRP